MYLSGFLRKKKTPRFSCDHVSEFRNPSLFSQSTVLRSKYTDHKVSPLLNSLIKFYGYGRSAVPFHMDRAHSRQRF